MNFKTIAASALIFGSLGFPASIALAQSSMAIMAGGDSMMVDASGGKLTVDSVEAPKDGFIVVHMMTDGKPGKVIGHATVKAGDNKDVEVMLDETPKSGDKLSLMLHDDTGQMGTYEFGMEGSKEDAPAMADGKPMMSEVTVK